MNILIAVVASSAGVFAAVTSMRAITCARLQREFRAYATWDDGAPAVAEPRRQRAGRRTVRSNAGRSGWSSNCISTAAANPEPGF
jgi:hypothetical protein